MTVLQGLIDCRGTFIQTGRRVKQTVLLMIRYILLELPPRCDIAGVIFFAYSAPRLARVLAALACAFVFSLWGRDAPVLQAQ